MASCPSCCYFDPVNLLAILSSENTNVNTFICRFVSLKMFEMSNLLYGSSNVYRHFSRATESGLWIVFRKRLSACSVHQTMFNAHLLTVESPVLVVSSVLENFIVAVCSDVPDDKVQLFARCLKKNMSINA